MERGRLKFSSLLFVICYLLFASFFGRGAHAQSPGFSVSPVKTFTTLRRGETYRGVFEIVNKSSVPLPLAVKAEFFGISDELGSVVFRDSLGFASGDNPDTWLVLSNPFLLLGPGEFRPVPYTLTVPADAAFGTYTIAAVFQSKFPELTEAKNSAQLLPGIGALFFVDVVSRPGEALAEKGQLTVKDFSIPESQIVQFRPFGASLVQTLKLDRISLAFIEGSPLTFTARLFNEGRYLARPIGHVSISNILGSEIGRVPFPDGAVLPEALRAYAISFTRTPRFPSLGFIPDFLQRGFLPGRYTARLVLDANSDYVASPGPSVITFWAFPRLFVLSTALPLTFLLLFVVLYRKRFLSALKVLLWRKS